jgi:hypothetical protein
VTREKPPYSVSPYTSAPKRTPFSSLRLEHNPVLPSPGGCTNPGITPDYKLPVGFSTQGGTKNLKRRFCSSYSTLLLSQLPGTSKASTVGVYGGVWKKTDKVFVYSRISATPWYQQEHGPA